MRIDGKLAAILGEHEVAFNVGSDNGVEKDDIVTVYRVIEVEDPDSKEVLGSVLTPRMRFRITLVQPRMSVGQSYESIVNPDSEGTWASNLMLRSVVKRVTTVRSKETWNTVFLQVGDPVVIQQPEKEPSAQDQELEEGSDESADNEQPEENEGASPASGVAET